MPENTAFHIVTKKNFKLGQVIVLNEKTKNNLYNHFIAKNIANDKNEDIINIINNNVTIDSLVLDKEDKNVLLRYCDITTKAIRETVVEMVRLQEYSQYPSRFSCIFATKEYSDIKKWKEIFYSYNRNVLQIVQLKYEGNTFEGNPELLPKPDGASFSTKIMQAKDYWGNNKKIEFPELLITGKIEIIEIIEDDV